MDTIKVTIDAERGKISIWNNGMGIPVKMHAKEQCYVPELIFGHLLTGSNFDDTERKVTGGRNGYGAKLANIFSKEFTVETCDGKQKYVQTWSKNMSKAGTPKITASDDAYTMVSFTPDLARFGMTNLDDDIVSLFTKRVYDIAGCNNNLKVYLNGKKLPVKDFKSYIGLYMNDPKMPMVYEKVNDRWEIGLTISDSGQFNQVSFVNSIATVRGGKHVDYALEGILSTIAEAVNKKAGKGTEVKNAQIKHHLFVFVRSLIENPAFDSQTKETLTGPAKNKFGSKCELSSDFLKKVIKSGFVETVLAWVQTKQRADLGKAVKGQSRGHVHIPKLDDANDAGTKNGEHCTLILTEGDSAKTLAVSGLGVVGRDRYGVFPLRGKLLNVRDANHKQLLENAEIQNIVKILGLKMGEKYTSAKSLRYGHVMIMADQDHDGSHIKGLLINMFAHFWPTLLRIKGFLQEFITPIVKVSRGRNHEEFFSIPEFEQWLEQHNRGTGWKIKYYKGLGTSTAPEAVEYFRNLDRHEKTFVYRGEEDEKLIDLAFSKKRADDRKEWLRQCEPGTFLDQSVREIPYEDFINRELVLFSLADCERSIPNVMDGLKPGQRKILFSCFKRNLKDEIKVAQLAGYVSEHSAYHHGEQSLQATIVNMAQNYVGSNNVNYLKPIGQFGTRLGGGKDSASPRYIFTSLNPITRYLFPAVDDNLLKYMEDDGLSVQPEWYAPIIPTVLVNGAEGIGTGWATKVPTFNPREIVENIRKKMQGLELLPMTPWFHGFTGVIEPAKNKDSFNVLGVWERVSETVLKVTELPAGTWTSDFKAMLEAMVAPPEGKPALLKDFKDHSSDRTVSFTITFMEDKVAEIDKVGVEKTFKLKSSVSTGNMVLFEPNGRIRKYASTSEIIDEFYDIRMQHYHDRKKFQVEKATEELRRLENKVRFVTMVVKGELVIVKKRKVDLLEELERLKFAKFAKKAGPIPSAPASEDGEDEVPGANYEYLLGMSLWSLTFEKVEELLKEQKAKSAELDELLATSPAQMWDTDLTAFLGALDIHEQEIIEEGKQVLSAKKKKPAKKKSSAYDFSDDDGDDAVYTKPAVKKQAPLKLVKAPAKPAVKAEVKREEAKVEAKPVVKPVAKPAVAKAAKAEPKKVVPVSITSMSDSESDRDDDSDASVTEVVKPKKAAVKKPAAVTAPKSQQQKLLFGAPAAAPTVTLSDSEEDFVMTVAKPSAPSPKRKLTDSTTEQPAKRPAATTAKLADKVAVTKAPASFFTKPAATAVDSDDEPIRPVITKTTAKRKIASDSESEELAPKKVALNPSGKNTALPPKKIALSPSGKNTAVPSKKVIQDDSDGAELTPAKPKASGKQSMLDYLIASRRK
eukprot:TRINITY_DN1007_c0_g1_i3.p1 TRINITY_DN1007_c0_g1~~TRINITY_DN1007_c0_g1_i3.p1  ORF type:complete len:1456 (-),score=395.08 TRINITY_DN1007_c0_g1_i3:700-4800(-)